MTKTVLFFTALLFFTACSSTDKKPTPEPITFQEGVQFLDEGKVQSSFCYAYGLDEGKLSARKRVKELALSEAIQASSVKIMSSFESRYHCKEGEASCDIERESYFKQVSNSFYENVTLNYTDVGPSKVCVVAVGDVIEIIPEEAPKKVDNFILTLNKDFINNPDEIGERFQEMDKCIEPALVQIKAGTYLMGNDTRKSERPVHKVTIGHDFYLGKYEVTKGEFRRFINSTNYVTDAQKEGSCVVYKDKHVDAKGIHWDNTPFFQGDNEPVVCVSYNDAQNYIKWLNQQSQSNYRLPTETEWEYAARAGTTTLWSFGDNKKEYPDHAWYAGNSGKQTHPVGTKKVNPWGIYDLSGNVWEWCEDSFTSYDKTPRDETAYVASNTKTLRGAAWVTRISPISYRWKKHATSRYYAVGFRLAQDRP